MKENSGTGFLISNQLVLTSAHIFKSEDSGVISLIPESFSIREKDLAVPRQIKVVKFKINP